MYKIDDLFFFKRGRKSEEFFDIVMQGELCVYFPGTNIRTYAQSSKRFGMTNIIYFSTKNGGNIWYIIQLTNFIDGYFFDGKGINPVDHGIIEVAIKALSENSIEFHLKSFEGKLDGVILSQTRPYHFIYDQMVNLFDLFEFKGLPKEKIYIDNTVFFDSFDGQPFQKQRNGCYLFPTTHSKRRSGEVVDKFHEKIISRITAKEYSEECVIWFGVTGQKRSWVEQVDSCIEIIKEMKKNYKTVALIVDGWTSYKNKKSFTKEDCHLFIEIKSGLISIDSVSIFNVIDMNYEDKISYAKNIDFFISNSGSGSIIPLMFLKKKGVIHGKLKTFSGCYDERVRNVPINKMDVEDSGVIMNDSYSFHWAIVYNLLVSLGMEGTNLEEKKVNNLPLKFPFEKISFNAKNEPADVLRDVALGFEASGDISIALCLMEKALEKRPNGKLIQRKIYEYRSILSSKYESKMLTGKALNFLKKIRVFLTK